ncbi:hypothetical protein HN827_01035 [archaeon]|nr:hypothetical protein [archaeon]MBT4648470.1 hypothetical protein [archaeon]MBT6821721.1 hypothetical protein [archaeon]MBT7391384.1 hypothetical protein [archaeon]
MNILFGGKAGQGINELSIMIGKVATNLGYWVFNYKDYQSLIRGGHNFNVLCISDKPIKSYDNKIDLLVALDQNTIEFHKDELSDKNEIISEEIINSRGLIREHKLDKKVVNAIYAGSVIKKLGIELNELESVFNENFSGEILKHDILAAKLGNELVEEKYSLKKVGDKKYFINGNYGIAIGAIASGLDIYFAYPMSPATTILHDLAKKQIEYNYVVHQPENELGAINNTIGAAFAGAKTFTSTSGGGFDLMSETLSLQGISEIPLVVALIQRQGPGTGAPTYTSQGDLNAALYSGHGDFSRILIAPGDAKECIELTNQAFYLSYKFGLLSIILSDKHLAEDMICFEKPPEILDVKDRNHPNYPGKTIVKATSYEHLPNKETTEDPIEIKKGIERRLEKIKDYEKEIENFKTTKIYGNGKNLIIGFGSTKGAILDSLDELNAKFLQILYLEPFPKDKVKKMIEDSQDFIVVENNVVGQLSDLITKHTGIIIPKEKRLLKYDAMPFTPHDIVNSLVRWKK